MLSKCNVCLRKILPHSYHLFCTSCKNPTHLNCLRNVNRDDQIYINRNNNTWYCTNCIEDTLPFTNIIDDDEYLSVIHEQLYQLDAQIDELNDNNFLLNELTEIDDIDLNDPLLENDPDIHFYQTDDILSKPSNYYDINSYKDKFKCTIDDRINSNFSLFHHNIRSIPQNLNKLTAYLHMLPIEFSIIGISETWLTENSVGCYHIPGYNSEHLYRNSRRGGGVSIFIKNDIKYKRRADLDIINDNIEAIFIEIRSEEFDTNKNIIIGVIYRPPNTDLQNFIDVMRTGPLL